MKLPPAIDRLTLAVAAGSPTLISPFKAWRVPPELLTARLPPGAGSTLILPVMELTRPELPTLLATRVTLPAASTTGALPAVPCGSAFVIVPPAESARLPELEIVPELNILPVVPIERSRLLAAAVNPRPFAGTTVDITPPGKFVTLAALMKAPAWLELVE